METRKDSIDIIIVTGAYAYYDAVVYLDGTDYYLHWKQPVSREPRRGYLEYHAGRGGKNPGFVRVYVDVDKGRLSATARRIAETMRERGVQFIVGRAFLCVKADGTIVMPEKI